jgi:uncharacterized protein YkwD
VDLVNAERQKAGLAPLVVEPHLSQAAQRYVELMASSGCFAHTCGPLPELPQRVEAAGYTSWLRLGENIAGGQKTPEEVVAGWMGSPGHRENILNPDYTQIGVGQARGGPYGVYWGQVFGRPAPLAPAPLPPQEAASRAYDLINAERQKAGAPPLQVNAALSQEAQRYAETMAGANCFGSSCGNTPELQQRVEDAGYTSWSALAEGLAAGQTTPEDAVAQWVSGSGQTALDPKYSDVGVGVAYGGQYRIYWAETLGSQATDGTPPPGQ